MELQFQACQSSTPDISLWDLKDEWIAIEKNIMTLPDKYLG